MPSSISRRSLLNYIGIGILLAGMAAGEFIYWRGLQENSSAAEEMSPYDSRVYEQDVQRYVGVFGLLMDQWSRALGKLREPKPLGITIIVLSLLAAGACFLAASRFPREF